MSPQESTVKYVRHEEILSPQGVLKVIVAHALMSMSNRIEMIIKLTLVYNYIFTLYPIRVKNLGS